MAPSIMFRNTQLDSLSASDNKNFSDDSWDTDSSGMLHVGGDDVADYMDGPCERSSTWLDTADTIFKQIPPEYVVYHDKEEDWCESGSSCAYSVAECVGSEDSKKNWQIDLSESSQEGSCDLCTDDLEDSKCSVEEDQCYCVETEEDNWCESGSSCVYSVAECVGSEDSKMNWQIDMSESSQEGSCDLCTDDLEDSKCSVEEDQCYCVETEVQNNSIDLDNEEICPMCMVEDVTEALTAVEQMLNNDELSVLDMVKFTTLFNKWSEAADNVLEHIINQNGQC